jgi:CBS domain-containing protein
MLRVDKVANKLLLLSVGKLNMRVADRMTPNPIVVLGCSLTAARVIMRPGAALRATGSGSCRKCDDGRSRDGLVPYEYRRGRQPDASQRIGCLPVTEDGGLVGIITTTDLLRALLDLARVHAKEG